MSRFTIAKYLAAKAAAVKKRDDAAAKIGELEAKLKNTSAEVGLKNQFADRFSQYVETGELTAGIVSDVLEEVIVYPDNRLQVVWNYQEDLKRMLLDIGVEETGQNP